MCLQHTEGTAKSNVLHTYSTKYDGCQWEVLYHVQTKSSELHCVGRGYELLLKGTCHILSLKLYDGNVLFFILPSCQPL